MTTINETLRALIAEMAAGDVPDPLAQPCTLALVWADLARLAGEPLPAEVAVLIDAPIPLRRLRSVPKRATRRGPIVPATRP